ncbi:MAG: FkbM family methyltransferase [Alphaproteobacteria bacterium]
MNAPATPPAHPVDILDFLDKQGVMLPPLKIVDVGAMDVGEGEPWARLVESGAARLVGFEPNADEYRKLTAAGRPNTDYLPHALGDGAAHTLYVGAVPMTSSLFAPDPKVMQQFHSLWELCETAEEIPVDTVRLDDIADVRPMDFLKLDIQGAELMALGAATSALADTVAIQVEVAFLPIYKDQPLFADVDTFLRAHGFAFHTMVGVGSRPFRPLIKDANPNRGFAQVIWSNALYFRDTTDFPRLVHENPDAVLKIAILAHEMYGAFDLAAVALQHYGAAQKQGLATAYIRTLTAADPTITAQK